MRGGATRDHVMGVQFDSITAAPDCSLTFIMGDLGRRSGHAAQADIEAWLNALARQSTSIVASQSGRDQLEAWLDAIEDAGFA